MLIKATRENLAKVNEAVEDFLADKPISFKTRTQIDLAVEEIYINIASYAYPDSEGNAEIILSENNGEFVMTFIDEGVLRLQSPIRIPPSAPRKDRSEDSVFFL